MKKIRVITGDILICKANIFPVIEHFGVVVVEGSTTCVYHCSPGKNVSCETLADFTKIHEVKEVRRTNINRDTLYRKYKEVRHRQYDLNDFNCIHFAKYITEE